MQATPSARDSLRMAAVEEHVRHENRHDLDGLLSTFGGNAVYEDGPWGERHDGLGAVREYYEGLFRAAPDLHVDVKKRHVGDDAIVLEVV
ncbi:MAG: nuclear transport factor 2 family protein, partial [Deltaproteobacteria bacterium]